MRHESSVAPQYPASTASLGLRGRRFAVVVALGSLLSLPVLAQDQGRAPALSGEQKRLAAQIDKAYRSAGLSAEQAAAHALNRLTYGPRPGEVERVALSGVGRYVAWQLLGQAEELEPLERRLESMPAMTMDRQQIAATYVNPGQALRMMQRQGMTAESMDLQSMDEQERREALRKLFEDSDVRPVRELMTQLQVQKLMRAMHSENQLREMLTEFWANHLFVSAQHPQARTYLLSYERDAIRPNVLGSFRELLGESARHPAMLLYLDNATSGANPGRRTTLELRQQQMRSRAVGRRGGDGARRARAGNDRGPRGLNENYGRELLELHTLGVDGGYTQHDVVEVARAFTGWMVLPPQGRRQLPPERMRRFVGMVDDNGFVFNPGRHDAEKKTVLGHALEAGRGIEDGEQVLDILARHPSTARHLARKLAVRFVDDQPPESLIERLSVTWIASGGDLTEVMQTLLSSPEFWSSDALGSKIKSPFEYAVSSLRATGADLRRPMPLLQWVGKMGQPLYSYGAPTGFPDSAEEWISSGSLLNRMNFGLALASGGIEGVGVDLGRLRRDASGQQTLAASLETYSKLLLPGRPAQETMQLLEPALSDPDLAQHVVGLILGSPEFQRR